MNKPNDIEAAIEALGRITRGSYKRGGLVCGDTQMIGNQRQIDAYTILSALEAQRDEMKPVLAMYQTEGEDYNVRTIIDDSQLDPYKTLFLWTTFHKHMSQRMLDACGCPTPPKTEGE